jgi:flagellar biosynthesis chaperone FliJ
MPRFSFELEPVLDQRRAQERERQRVVGQLEAERLALEARLASTRASFQLERADLRSALAPSALSSATTPDPITSGVGPVDLASVRLQAHAGFRCATEERRLILALAGLHERLARARAALLEATKRRKGVELLKANRKAEFDREQSRREDALLDEIAVTRARTRENAL